MPFDAPTAVPASSVFSITAPSQETKNRPSLAFLSRYADEIYGDNHNHSKGVITDTGGIMSSANIDPIGLETGFEVGVLLTQSERAAALKHIQQLIKANPKNLISKCKNSKN